MTQRFNRQERGGATTRSTQQDMPEVSTDLPRQNMSQLMETAQQLGVRLKEKNVDMNQLRNFYETVVQLGIELEEEQREKLRNRFSTNSQELIESNSTNRPLIDRAEILPTKLIWAAARQEGEDKKQALRLFSRYVEVFVVGLFDQQHHLSYQGYERFRQFVEAVIIYHKAKDKRVI